MSATAPPPPSTRSEINDLIGELAQKIQDEFELSDFLEGRIQELDIDLTPSGTLMLLLPLHDLNDKELSRTDVVSDQDQVVLDRGEFEGSLRALLSTIAESPAPADVKLPQGPPPAAEERAGRFRSAISVVKAYWQKFCEIPPICGK